MNSKALCVHLYIFLFVIVNFASHQQYEGY